MKKVYKTFLIFAFMALILLSITYSKELKKAGIEALLISGNSIIPSLFPTISIISIMINSGLIFSVNKRILPIFLFVLSQVSGYPTGSQILNIAVKMGILEKQVAEKLLPSMMCSGPAFVISFVGCNIFNSQEIGIRLYISMVLANLIIFISSGGLSVKTKEVYIKTELKNTFLSSVLLSSESVMKISVIFIFFYTFIKGLGTLLSKKINLIIALIFEVTGCAVLSKNMYLTCAALAWGGICVHLQIKSFAEKYALKYFHFAVCRIIALLLSCLLLKLSTFIYPLTSNVFSNIQNVAKLSFGGNVGFVIVFALTIVTLLISVTNKKASI